MKINQKEMSIVTNSFNAKGVVYIDCNCNITSIKNDCTVVTVSSSRFKDVDAFIKGVELDCDYIDDACDAASEQYCD